MLRPSSHSAAEAAASVCKGGDVDKYVLPAVSRNDEAKVKGGAGFWGCSNYPKCKSRLPMVAALR